MVLQLELSDAESPALRAADAIKSAIHDARFGPGQRLVESELTQLLGLGRGPVREALRLLAVEGLVTIERNRGAVVARVTKGIVAEVFEMRELLEGLSARRAARAVRERGSAGSLAQAIDDEVGRGGHEDPASLIEANERLHGLIVATGASGTAERVLGQLRLPKLRSLFFRVMSPAHWATSRDDHIAILRAIVDGDEDRADDLMRAHVKRTADLFATLPERFFL